MSTLTILEAGVHLVGFTLGKPGPIELEYYNHHVEWSNSSDSEEWSEGDLGSEEDSASDRSERENYESEKCVGKFVG